jgi:spermidine synthase
MKYILIFFIFFFIFLLIFYQIKVFTYNDFKPEPKEFTDNNLEQKELNLNNINLLEMKENNPILSCKNNNDIHFVEKENDMVILDENSSKFELSTFKNNFSYCRLYVDFILKENVNRKTILVLGFGLGGIPLELSLDNKINEIDCVDINICMFKLYNTLIQNKPNKLHYYLLDAKEYLKNTSKTYDIIIDDAFYYNTKEFYDFESGYNKLNNDGWLLINMHHMSDYEKYESLLKKLFRNIQIDTRRNICIFCQK